MYVNRSFPAVGATALSRRDRRTPRDLADYASTKPS